MATDQLQQFELLQIQQENRQLCFDCGNVATSFDATSDTADEILRGPIGYCSKRDLFVTQMDSAKTVGCRSWR